MNLPNAFMRMRQIEKQKKTWENKRKQSVFLGFSFVFFCFSNWPKAQIQFVELTYFYYFSFSREAYRFTLNPVEPPKKTRRTLQSCTFIRITLHYRFLYIYDTLTIGHQLATNNE